MFTFILFCGSWHVTLVLTGILSISKHLVPVSLNILSLRFSSIPYKLYGTYENLKFKIFSETGTCCCQFRLQISVFQAYKRKINASDLVKHACQMITRYVLIHQIKTWALKAPLKTQFWDWKYCPISVMKQIGVFSYSLGTLRNSMLFYPFSWKFNMRLIAIAQFVWPF